MKRLLHNLAPLIGLVLLCAALLVLHHELKAYHYRDILRHLHEMPARSILWGVALTIVSYLVLTGYDTLAVRYVQHPLPYGKTALVSFIAYAFSHNMGFAALSGGSVRYRLYSAWGFSAIEVTKVVVFCGLTFWLGFLTLAGASFILKPPPMPPWLHLPFGSLRPLGAVFFLAIGAWVLLSLLKRKPLKFRDWEIPIPSSRLLLAQIVVSCVDWAFAASVLYVLLPPEMPWPYLRILSLFLLAQIAGMASQIPGGLGVFETVVLLSLSPSVPGPAILGSLLAYRAIYYLLPLCVGAVLLGIHEVVARREKVQRLARLFGQWVPALVPQVFAMTTFVAGAILLFSGATPTIPSRLARLKALFPLPVVEISHFMGSLAGVGLLLLAWGLWRRLDAAYLFSGVLLVVGIVFSLLKGFDFEEALLLTILLAALLPCHQYFYRKASLFSQPFALGWIVAVLSVLLGSAWLFAFSHRHVEFSNNLWWQFAFHGDAARSLRATVGASVAVLVLAAIRLMGPRPPEPRFPTAAQLDRAHAIIRNSAQISAHLALLGDKMFLFNDTGTAFLMYGIEGRSWVALGDPVGPEDQGRELVWEFREMCDRHGGWAVFYEVGPETLPLYLDLGLTVVKLGEEGRVRLDNFSLEGGARRGIRQALHRAETERCSFEIVPIGQVPPLLPEFRRISDAWLAEKHTREKRFSVGFFDEAYIRRYPAAIVRQQDRIVAFANVLIGSDKEQLSIDLMRYLPELRLGLMDYLFANLMLWGKQEGFRWFNLGMAPLSGLETRALASLWTRLGAFVFQYGEHFYNFQGVRQYKDKFDPEWKPKYLACPGGLVLPLVLANVASLISGGLKGVVAK